MKTIRYATGKIIDSASWFTDKDIALNKMVFANANDLPIWQNGYGNAILSVNPNNKNLFYLGTHFNPAWNDLVWNKIFPNIMLSILLENKEQLNAISKYDFRQIDRQQLLVNKNQIATDDALIIKNTTKDISSIIWLIAFMVFSVERWLSLKVKTLT